MAFKHLLSVQPVILLSKDVLRRNTPADRSYVLWLGRAFCIPLTHEHNTATATATALHLPEDSQLKLSAWRKSKEHFLLIRGVNKIRTVDFVTSAQAKKIVQCTNKKICYSK